MEAIDSIKIVQVDGLTGAGRGAGAANDGGGGGERNLANSAVSAPLRYRAQAPIVDGLMKELGFDGGSLEGLVAAAVEKNEAASKPSLAEEPAADPAEDPATDLAAE